MEGKPAFVLKFVLFIKFSARCVSWLKWHVENHAEAMLVEDPDLQEDALALRDVVRAHLREDALVVVLEIASALADLVQEALQDLSHQYVITTVERNPDLLAQNEKRKLYFTFNVVRTGFTSRTVLATVQ